jgi:hypothetical protein
MAIVVAVQTLSQEWNGSPFIDHGSDADLDEFGVIPISVGDMSREDSATVGRRPRGVLRARLRRRIGSVEVKMGRVKVQAVEREFRQLNNLGGKRGLDGMALGEKGIQRSSQPIIVERVRGDVPEAVRPGAFGPSRDVDEGGGLTESGGEQKAENAPVRESQLRIGGQVAVDDGGQVEALEEWCDEGQGAKGQCLVGEGRSEPSVCHRASTKNGGDKEAGSEWHGNDSWPVKRQAAVKKNRGGQHNDDDEA